MKTKTKIVLCGSNFKTIEYSVGFSAGLSLCSVEDSRGFLLKKTHYTRKLNPFRIKAIFLYTIFFIGLEKNLKHITVF